MIGLNAFGCGHVGGLSALGSVDGLTARQTNGTNIGATWGYTGDDESANIYILVYLDGRLMQILPGTALNTEVASGSYATHNLDVFPWARHHVAPDEWYGGLATYRAHLEWTRPNDSSIAYYNIYRSATAGGSYTLYATHNKPGLETGEKSFASGARCTIAGHYDGAVHTNTKFTLTITNAATNRATLTNDKDGNSVSIGYTIGAPVILLDGITATIIGTPINNDAITFIAGVQPFYDTAVLAEGAHYFKISSVDTAGNIATQHGPIFITITQPPLPVTDFEVTYDESNNYIMYSLTGSETEAVDVINIYSNYIASSNTLLDSVYYGFPFLLVVTNIPGDPYVDELLLATGKPNGTYKFVARARTNTGLEEQNGVYDEVVLPYVPAALTTPYSITATPTAGGAVILTWLSDLIPAGGWRITGLVGTITVTPTASEFSNAFKFTTSLTAGQVGAEGSKTVLISARNAAGTFFGNAGTVTFIADATAPTAVTGAFGVPF